MVGDNRAMAMLLWWWLKINEIEEFFGLTFECMGNDIRSKKNTLKPVFDQSISFG